MMIASRSQPSLWRWTLAALVLLLATTLPGFAQATQPPLASDRAAAPAADVAPAPDQASKLSFLHLLVQGGWAMIPLALCSLIGVALIIERGLALRRSQIVPSDFFTGLNKVYQSTLDTDPALAYCRKRPSAAARIMAAAIRKLPGGLAPAEQAVADQGSTEVARMRRNLRLLHGISALTPTIGLLGTVWGMIRAFEAASRVGLGHSEQLTTGIYEALVATMSGLLIAVPVLFFYYLYLGQIDRLILDLNDASQAFLERHTPSIAELEPLRPAK
jgi:biopolymer transport protein ExbB